MKKKVIITGIGGYVGSAIAHELIAEGCHVFGIGHDENFHLLQEAFGENVELISGDVTDEKKLKEAFQDADVVIHTASPTTEKFCIEKPRNAYQTIVYGTRMVTRVVKELHIPLLVHVSTQAVYMNFTPRELPLREDMDPRPDTLYGTLKYAAECEVLDAGAPAIIVRPANIYGKNPLGVVRETVITTFAEEAKKGGELVIKGDGLQRADYVHLLDVVQAIGVLAVRHATPLAPEIYNLGSGVSRSLTEVAECVRNVGIKHGFPESCVRYETSDKKTAADRMLSIERMKGVIPEYPSISFEDGIQELF